LGANDKIRNGQDRQHHIYGLKTFESNVVEKNEEIRYTFPRQKVSEVHIVFDSDLNRNTIPGGIVEKTHPTRANISLSAPVMHMPTTLCKDFALIGSVGGKTDEILSVKNNRKRCYHIPVNKEYDTLTLTLNDSWGDEKIPLISFDFN
jgi:hypothetical protein